MTVHDRGLADAAQRALAVTAHDRSLLVEAGAGSGKTAVLAGRIAMLPATLALIASGSAKKGDVIGIARIAEVGSVRS